MTTPRLISTSRPSDTDPQPQRSRLRRWEHRFAVAVLTLLALAAGVVLWSLYLPLSLMPASHETRSATTVGFGEDAAPWADAACLPISSREHLSHSDARPHIKVLYVTPKDVTPRPRSVYPSIERTVRETEWSIAHRSGNAKTLRFDRGVACNANALDITHVTLPVSTGQLAGNARVLVAELGVLVRLNAPKSPFGASRKYLVVLDSGTARNMNGDGVEAGNGMLGISDGAHGVTANGGTIAVVPAYIDSYVVAHELLHAFNIGHVEAYSNDVMGDGGNFDPTSCAGDYEVLGRDVNDSTLPIDCDKRLYINELLTSKFASDCGQLGVACTFPMWAAHVPTWNLSRRPDTTAAGCEEWYKTSPNASDPKYRTLSRSYCAFLRGPDTTLAEAS